MLFLYFLHLVKGYRFSLFLELFGYPYLILQLNPVGVLSLILISEAGSFPFSRRNFLFVFNVIKSFIYQKGSLLFQHNFFLSDLLFYLCY